MQVLTLDPDALDAHTARLAEKVMAGHPYIFDAIIAVRRGGAFVCDAFCRHFPKSAYGERFDVTLQRPSTKRKSSFFTKVLKSLPYPILNFLRIAEACFLNSRSGTGKHSEKHAASCQVVLPEGLIRTLKISHVPDILIIDDAIDSGNTLFAIVQTLKHMNPDVKVLIAVITQTTHKPRIQPDYSLYSNRTLIRFPWSNDYKTKI